MTGGRTRKESRSGGGGQNGCIGDGTNGEDEEKSRASAARPPGAALAG